MPEETGVQELENTDISENKMEKTAELPNECEEKLAKMTAEKQEWEEKFLRISADLQNVRRRAEEDRIKARQEGTVAGFSPFLFLVDTLERAFAHISPEQEETDLVKGMRGMHKSCLEKLKNMGVEFFGETGDVFDENKHDSLLIDPSTEKGKIAMVLEKGVSFLGKTIVHAKVSVGTQEL